MKKRKVWYTVMLASVTLFVVGVELFADSTDDQASYTIRKVEPQVVLYTICRGSYEKTGEAVGKLFTLAGKKGIIPRGTSYYVYLNNNEYVSSEHLLTEIRIPVSKEALKHTGTLGEMTDVKTLPAIEFAVAVKPEGLAGPKDIYNNLHTWIIKQGYMATDCPCEIFLTNAMSGNYAQMKTEILIPIKKAPVTLK